MACYDCEDCSKHKDSGGKCTRWEYNCPFSHLKGWNIEEEREVEEDIKTSLELKQDLKALLDKYKEKFNQEYNYDSIINQLNHAYSELEEMTDEELIKEWNEIKGNDV